VTAVDDAAIAASRASQSNPRFTMPRALHAAALARMGRHEAAKAEVDRLLELDPQLTVTTAVRSARFVDPSHTQAIADDELHDYWTQLMDRSGAMLFGRNTYELMEGAWPAVARDEKAPRAMREWAQKLEAKAKYVVSGSRSDFPWQNTIKVEGDLREAISALKAKTERGVLVGAPKLAAALEELGLIDEYRIVVHPIISGRGPTLFHGLSSARHLELLSTQRFKSGVQALHFRRKSG